MRGLRRMKRSLPQNTIALVFTVVLLSSCAVAKTARWKPSVDTADLQIGASRTVIEGRMGKPTHEWDLPSGVHCASYEFEAGRLGSRGDASMMAFMDVATAGLWEVIDEVTPHALSENRAPLRMYFRRVLVTYGDDELARGFFEPYALVPDNGVSGPVRWTHP